MKLTTVDQLFGGKKIHYLTDTDLDIAFNQTFFDLTSFILVQIPKRTINRRTISINIV